MDSTVQALLQIDAQAVAIAASAADEKKTRLEANEKKIAEFDAKTQADTEASVRNQKEKIEKIISDEAASLKEKTDSDINALNRFYDANHDKLAGEIFEKVTGHKWEA